MQLRDVVQKQHGAIGVAGIVFDFDFDRGGGFAIALQMDCRLGALGAWLGQHDFDLGLPFATEPKDLAPRAAAGFLGGNAEELARRPAEECHTSAVVENGSAVALGVENGRQIVVALL